MRRRGRPLPDPGPTFEDRIRRQVARRDQHRSLARVGLGNGSHRCGVRDELWRPGFPGEECPTLRAARDAAPERTALLDAVSTLLRGLPWSARVLGAEAVSAVEDGMWERVRTLEPAWAREDELISYRARLSSDLALLGEEDPVRLAQAQEEAARLRAATLEVAHAVTALSASLSEVTEEHRAATLLAQELSARDAAALRVLDPSGPPEALTESMAARAAAAELAQLARDLSASAEALGHRRTALSALAGREEAEEVTPEPESRSGLRTLLSRRVRGR